MKSITYFLAFLLFILSNNTIKAQETIQKDKSSEISSQKVVVYYFHNTRRCATCQAVESVTQTSLEELYPEAYKNGEVSFQSLNIEDDTNEALARKLKVSGQTLLIVKDGKKKDLTNDAFMYARNQPEKLTEKIQKAIGTI